MLPPTIKILEENIGNVTLDIAQNNIVSNVSPQARETKEEISKRDYNKLKRVFTAKETINLIKRYPTEYIH